MSLGTHPAYKTTYGYYIMTDNTDSSGNARTADDGAGTPTYTFPGRFDITGMLIDANEYLMYNGGSINMTTSMGSMGSWYKSDALANAEYHNIIESAAYVSPAAKGSYIMMGMTYASAAPTLKLIARVSNATATEVITLAATTETITAYLSKWHLYGFSYNVDTDYAYLYIDGVGISPAGIAAASVTNAANAVIFGYGRSAGYAHGHHSHGWTEATYHSPDWWRKYWSWCNGFLD